MKREHIENLIEEFKNSRNEVYSFYVTYKETENIVSQKWGKIYELDKSFEDMSKSSLCIQGELPIERLIIFAKSQCMVFCKNDFWDCVNDDSEDSHFVVCVPYIAEDGMFGHIESDYKNGQYVGDRSDEKNNSK